MQRLKRLLLSIGRFLLLRIVGYLVLSMLIIAIAAPSDLLNIPMILAGAVVILFLNLIALSL